MSEGSQANDGTQLRFLERILDSTEVALTDVKQIGRRQEDELKSVGDKVTQLRGEIELLKAKDLQIDTDKGSLESRLSALETVATELTHFETRIKAWLAMAGLIVTLIGLIGAGTGAWISYSGSRTGLTPKQMQQLERSLKLHMALDKDRSAP